MRQYARTKVRFSTTQPADHAGTERGANLQRVAEELQFLASFRHVKIPAAVEIAPLLPISDDAVLDWVAKDRDARMHLSWPVAKSLAFIDTFKR